MKGRRNWPAAITAALIASAVVLLLSLGGCARCDMGGCEKMCGARGVSSFTETAVPGQQGTQPVCRCADGADGGAR